VLFVSIAWATDKTDLPARLGGELSRLKSRELMDKGLDYAQRDVPDSAMMCFSLVANRRFSVGKNDSTEQYYCARALNDIGCLYYDYFFDYKKAYEYFQEALDIANEHRINNVLPLVYNNLAALTALNYSLFPEDKSEMKDTIIAQYKNAFNIGRSLNSKDKHMAAIAINLALRTIEYDPKNKPEQELKAYLTLDDDTIQDAYMAKCLCKTALAYSRGSYQEAVEYIDLALTGISSVKDRGLAIIAKSMILSRTGQEAEAINLLENNIEFYTQNNRLIDALDAYMELYNMYRKRGDTEKAVKYELLYLRQKDIILNKSKIVDMNEQRLLTQIEKANKQAEQLAYKSRVKERILWIVIAFTLALVGLLALLYRKNRLLREQNRKLYENQVQLLAAEDEQQQAQAKYRKNTMGTDAKELLMERIEGVMRFSNEIFRSDFSLDRLAELTEASTTQLSQVINEVQGRNFYALLGEYRVKEACRRMSDTEHYGNQTIEAIAESVGFKSRSNFSKVFKAQTGLTPSAYQRLARSDNHSANS